MRMPNTDQSLRAQRRRQVRAVKRTFSKDLIALSQQRDRYKRRIQQQENRYKRIGIDRLIQLGERAGLVEEDA